MKKKYLFYVFVIFMLLFPCIAAFISNFTLTHDSANWFMNALNDLNSGNWHWGCRFPHRAHKIILILHLIPLNCAYHIFKIDSLNMLAHIYAVSFAAFPMILSIYSIYLCFRAQKKHLAVFPVFQALILLPLIQYGGVETFTSGFLFLILIQYFLFNFKLNRLDKILLVLLCISLYYSHESIVLYAPFMLAAYLKHSDKNSPMMKFCAVNAVCAFITMFIFAFTPFGPNILEGGASDSLFTFMHIPLFWKSAAGITVNFHALFYCAFVISLLSAFTVKNLKFNIILNAVFFIISAVLKGSFETNLFVSYKFLSIYLPLLLTAVMIFFLRKEDFIKAAALNSIPLICFMLISGNIYIFNYAESFMEFSSKLRQAAEKGYFYYSDDISFFENEKLFGYLMRGDPEQLAYSAIAVNSVKNRNKTKGLIIGYDKENMQIHKCGKMLHNEGGLMWIKPKTKFWDLRPYKEHFIQYCDE